MFICSQFIFRAIINVNERKLYNLFIYLFNSELLAGMLPFSFFYEPRVDLCVVAPYVQNLSY